LTEFQDSSLKRRRKRIRGRRRKKERKKSVGIIWSGVNLLRMESRDGGINSVLENKWNFLPISTSTMKLATFLVTLLACG